MKIVKDETPKTATELAILERARQASRMNWLMAKALVEGKINSTILRWAEQVYETHRDVFEVIGNIYENQELLTN